MRCMAVTSTALHNSHIHHHFINQLTVQHHNTHTAVTFGAPSARYRSLATKRPSPTTRETTIKTRSKTIKNVRSIVFQHKRYKSHQEQSKTRTHHKHRHRTNRTPQTNTISAYCAEPLVKPFECYHSFNAHFKDFLQSIRAISTQQKSKSNQSAFKLTMVHTFRRIRIIVTNISQELSRNKRNTKNEFSTNKQIKQFTKKARPVLFN